MKTPTIIACVMTATVALAPVVAGAQDDEAPPATAEARVASIPAHVRATERTVTLPPQQMERCLPEYAELTVPVYEQRRVPITETVEVPVYETVEVPVTRTERVPVWGEKEVTAFREVRKPVTIELWNPFACKDECIELWDRCERVPDGTRTVKAIVDHEVREVPCGTRLERRQVGTRLVERVTGHRCEQVQVGERTERRLVGHRTELVVTRPARTHVVRACEPVPCETVTVVPDGATRTDPLAGTTRVLTETEYERALAATR